MLSPIASLETAHLVANTNRFLNEVKKDRLLIFSESGDHGKHSLIHPYEREIYCHVEATARLIMRNLLKNSKMKNFRKLIENSLKIRFACLAFFRHSHWQFFCIEIVSSLVIVWLSCLILMLKEICWYVGFKTFQIKSSKDRDTQHLLLVCYE